MKLTQSASHGEIFELNEAPETSIPALTSREVDRLSGIFCAFVSLAKFVDIPLPVRLDDLSTNGQVV